MRMKVSAKISDLKITPRKTRLIASLIKGMDVEDALIQLKNTVKKSSRDMEKLLKSAIANAENNWGMDKDNLYVRDVRVDEGPIMKRWLPRAYGRATQILKRTSLVDIILDERVEGKNRKSREQMAKERKEREEKKKKLEKELREEKEKTAAAKAQTEKDAVPFREKRKEEEQKTGGQKGWMKKMFQRKSG